MAKLKVPYLKWRNGRGQRPDRPRWEPGPMLRARGFRGRDLKDASGAFLSRAAAIAAAEQLNVAAAAEASVRIPATPSGEKTMAALFDAYLASKKFLQLAVRTRRSYRQHLVILRAWCGEERVEALSRSSIAEFHAALEEGRGAAMANAILRTLKLTLNYALHELEWIARNRSTRLTMAKTKGRLVMWTLAEIEAFIVAAEAFAMHSQADALILGLLTGQRQGDVLSLREGAFAGGLYVLKTAKTNALAKVPAVKQLTQRIAAARARKARAWPGVAQLYEVIAESTGRPYVNPSRFAEGFRLIRAEAAKSVPSILEKRWADLRDTAVTWLFAAGCSDAEIATVTGHSLTTVRVILDKHYFVRNDAFSISAGNKLEAYLDRCGVKW